MQPFPGITAQNFSDKYSNNDILTRIESSYLDSITPNLQWWSEASVDTRFYAGDQTVWNEFYGNARVANNRQFNFNLIRRVVETTAGTQRKNRKSIIVTPLQNADEHTADQFTKILLWNAGQNGTLDTISEAFTGALITGMNLLQVWMDYREDPISGDIRVTNCPYNTFFIDPYFTRQDLSDCRFVWKRSYLSKEALASMFPDKADIIRGMQPGDRDGKFQYMPQSYNYNQNNLIVYDEYFYRDFRSQRLLVDSKTGATLEWKDSDEDLRLFLYAHDGVTVVNQTIPTVRCALVAQNQQVLYDGPNPLGIDRFPFVPVLAYYTPELPYLTYRCQGQVRALKDPQFIFNRRKIIEMDIFESQPNSGWIAEEDAVVDPQSLYKTGQGQVIWKKKGVPPESLQQIQAPQVPPSMFQASTDMEQLIMKVSGINEENLGASTDDIAGIISMLRQNAGMTSQQRLFDQLDVSQKILGQLEIDLIQANFTPGKVQDIIGEQPSERFFNKNFGRYDAVVEDGFNTSSQKQMQFAQALQLRQIGVPIPDSFLVESATLQNKTQLLELMQQEAQAAQQMQQAQAQSQLQQEQATMEMAHARAQADQATAIERISRVEENKSLAVERLAEAHKDEEAAFLNNIKAQKELQSIDLDHLERLSALTKIVKAEEQEQFEEQAIKQANLMKMLEKLSQSGNTPMAQPPMGQ